jgi:hypothetical protein
MSWIDHHKKFKEEFYNVDPEQSGFDFEDFELIYEKGGKFLSYPQAETFNETVDTAQTQPSNRSPSSEPLVLTMQEPQVCYLAHGCSNVLADSAIDLHENKEDCKQVGLHWSCSSIAEICTLGF